MDASTVPGSDETALRDISRRLSCNGCGRKGGIDATPHGVSWVRYLRRHNPLQRRIPWFQAFVTDED